MDRRHRPGRSGDRRVRGGVGPRPDPRSPHGPGPAARATPRSAPSPGIRLSRSDHRPVAILAPRSLARAVGIEGASDRLDEPSRRSTDQTCCAGGQAGPRGVSIGRTRHRTQRCGSGRSGDCQSWVGRGRWPAPPLRRAGPWRTGTDPSSTCGRTFRRRRWSLPLPERPRWPMSLPLAGLRCCYPNRAPSTSSGCSLHICAASRRFASSRGGRHRTPGLRSSTRWRGSTERRGPAFTMAPPPPRFAGVIDGLRELN